MKSIKITVTDCLASVPETLCVVSGTVGLPVEFSFDDAWAGLSKTAVFRANGKTMDVLNVTSFATVPWELLKTPGCRLWAGVYGTNPDGSLQIPTVWADLGVIQPGADPSGDESADPTLPVWEQLNAVKPYVVKLVYAYDEGSGEMIPSIADSFGFNWDDMVAAVKSNRPVMCYLSGVEGSDDVVDASAFELTYIEYANEFAIFSSTTEVGVEHITLVKDSTVVKHQQIGYVTEESFDEIVGNIETALDSILAIQEGLIGGGA